MLSTELLTPSDVSFCMLFSYYSLCYIVCILPNMHEKTLLWAVSNTAANQFITEKKGKYLTFL